MSKTHNKTTDTYVNDNNSHTYITDIMLKSDISLRIWVIHLVFRRLWVQMTTIRSTTKTHIHLANIPLRILQRIGAHWSVPYICCVLNMKFISEECLCVLCVQEVEAAIFRIQKQTTRQVYVS